MQYDLSDVLASLADGLYITDLERRIVYWNPAAERITGWRPEDVVGRQCLAEILRHVDKDGHQLCGEEHCPLHRSMVTGTVGAQETLVFGMTRHGDRVPMRVTTAPLRNSCGEIIGGVETFRAIESEYRDLQRAQRVQRVALMHPVVDDPRVWVEDHYVPRDIVGGDFHALKPLTKDRIAFWIGDVMGHGISAALYTMQMQCLWSEFAPLLSEPERFLCSVNERLIDLRGEDHSFATALFGTLHIPSGELILVSAGGPPPLHFRPDGTVRWDEDLSGIPLGVLPGMPFDRTTVTLARGDAMLFYTDGASEVSHRSGALIGSAGLADIARECSFHRERSRLQQIEAGLLAASDTIHLPDDVTLLEVRLNQ